MIKLINYRHAIEFYSIFSQFNQVGAYLPDKHYSPNQNFCACANDTKTS